MLDEIDQHRAGVHAELGRQSLGERWGKQTVRLFHFLDLEL